MLPDREIHVVDSQGASMAESILCFMGRASWRSAGCRAPRRSPRSSRTAPRTCGCTSRSRRSSTSRRAGGSAAPRRRSGRSCRSSRSSPSRTARSRRPTSRGPGRSPAQRCIELITARPIERIAILHTMAPDVEAFRAEVIRLTGLDRRRLGVDRRTVGRPTPRPRLRRSRRPVRAADRRGFERGPDRGPPGSCGVAAGGSTLAIGPSVRSAPKQVTFGGKSGDRVALRLRGRCAMVNGTAVPRGRGRLYSRWL